MARRRTATPPGAGPLPTSVAVSRDRDGRVVHEVERGGRRGFVLVLCFLVVAVTAALAVVEALRTRTVPDTGIALSLSSLALVLWAAFLGVDRTRVRVLAGVCVVHRDGAELRYDLRNPLVGVDCSGDVRSARWRADLTGPAGHRVTLRRSQVDPAGFLAVVAVYRPRAAPGPAGS